MQNAPKLLLIAGYYPPVRISAGSIRPWSLTRYLIDLGWEVTVVTPKISIWNPRNLDGVENVAVEIQKIGIKMIYTDHLLKCLAPARYKIPQGKVYWFFGGLLRVATRRLGVQNWVGWVPSALYACRNMKPNDVDVIVATGAPFWGFEVAYRLSKKINRPYVMDYRDLWTDNPWNRVSQKWVSQHERRLLQYSTAITIVSPISGEVLAKKYNVGNKIHTITNGYDAKDVTNVQKKSYDHFSIVFAGSLISAKNTLSPLFKALNDLKRRRNDAINWKFHYFGPNTEVVNNEVVQWNIEEESIIHGNCPRDEVLQYSKGASLNVILSSDGNSLTIEDKGVIPGKVFELIGLEASILPIVPKGSAIESVLKEVGVEAFSHEETDKISNFIIECMNGREVKIINQEMYSWDKLSKQFDLLLKDCILNWKR